MSQAEIREKAAKSKNIFEFIMTHVPSFTKSVPRVCEIGCDVGGNLIAFADNGWDVSGYDYNERRVEIGREHLSFENLFVGGVDEFCSRRHTVDPIILNHLAEHFFDLAEKFGKLTRDLEKGTLLFIGVPGIEHWMSMKNQDFRGTVQMAHTYYFSPKTLNKVLLSQGFEKICGNHKIDALYVYDGNKEIYQSSPEEFQTILTSISRHFESHKVRRSVVQDLISRDAKIRVFKAFNRPLFESIESPLNILKQKL